MKKKRCFFKRRRVCKHIGCERGLGRSNKCGYCYYHRKVHIDTMVKNGEKYLNRKELNDSVKQLGLSTNNDFRRQVRADSVDFVESIEKDKLLRGDYLVNVLKRSLKDE